MKLRELAQSLGLSVTTVSRALGGYPEVSEQTRAIVREAADRLGYVPNPIAQKLVSGRSGMVGLITLRPVQAATDPSFTETILGLSSCLTAHDIDLILRVGIEDDVVEPYRRLAAKGALDAFILNAPSPNDPRIAYLRAQKIAFVVHGRDCDAPDYAFYDIDNYQVGVDSAEYLVSLGHRRIAMLNGPEGFSFARERLRGFRDVMAAHGLTVPDGYVHHAASDEYYGYAATSAMMTGQTAPIPTAIICASTLTATGVLRALADRNIAVPKEISVMAHDDGLPDHRPARMKPTLTVTHLPMREACQPLADMVVGLLDGAPLEKLQTTVMAELIVRGSTGPVRAP